MHPCLTGNEPVLYRRRYQTPALCTVPVLYVLLACAVPMSDLTGGPNGETQPDSATSPLAGPQLECWTSNRVTDDEAEWRRLAEFPHSGPPSTCEMR